MDVIICFVDGTLGEYKGVKQEHYDGGVYQLVGEDGAVLLFPLQNIKIIKVTQPHRTTEMAGPRLDDAMCSYAT